MRNSQNLRILALGALVAIMLNVTAFAGNAAQSKVNPTSVTVTEYTPDDTVTGAAPLITDGDLATRWMLRNAADKDLPIRLVMDMGTARVVSKVRIANYYPPAHGNLDRGIRLVDIFVGDTRPPAAGGTPAAADIQANMSDAAGVGWTDIPLAKPVTGRYVTVRIRSNWGAANYAANEVEIYTDTAATPGTPGTNPTTPGTNPTTPGTNPTTPGTNPTTPGTNPTTPGTNPTTPGTNPAAPGTNPTTPGTNPATPVVKDVLILSTFPADYGPSHKDHPDEAGAVGPNHVVDSDDGYFVVHDKKTGIILLKKTQEEFWADVEPINTLILNTNDPRILYDPLSSRWFAVNTGKIDARSANGYLAVSTSADPTKPWKGVKLPMPPQDLGFKIGVDKNGFYATYINQTTDVNTMHDCLAIPKTDIIAADGPDLSHATTFHNLQIECFPATDLNPNKAATAPEVLLNKEFGNTAGKLYLYKITWVGNKASISDVQTIALGKTYASPNGASQKNLALQPDPGGKLRADEGRRTICVYAHGGSVYGCNSAKRDIDSRPGVLWYEVRVRDGALLQEGFMDSKDYDYLCPSLAVDADGNIGLGCTRTSADEYPSIIVMLHAAGDAAGTMRTPVLAVAGKTYFRNSKAGPYGIGWGNYSPTVIDPDDPLRFWTCQQYQSSAEEQQWCTAWVSFKYNTPAKP